MDSSCFEAFNLETMVASCFVAFVLETMHSFSFELWSSFTYDSCLLFISLLKILTRHLSFHHVLWFQLIVRVIIMVMVLTRHSSFCHILWFLTHCLSYYHVYDFNSSFELPYFVILTHHFEFLPFFVILTHLLSFHHIYDFNSSFELLPFRFFSRLWFELVARFWVLPFHHRT